MSIDNSPVWQKWGAIGTCASAVVALISVAVYIWQAVEANRAQKASIIAKEVLKTAQVRVETLQEKTAIQETALSNALEQVSLYGDIIAAEGGDRWAYVRASKRLYPIAETNIAGMADFFIMRLYDGIRRFRGHPSDNPMLKSIMFSSKTVFFDDESVSAGLKASTVTDRLFAINTVRVRRMYSLLPTLVHIVEDDPDLTVVQFALDVVTSVLGKARHGQWDFDDIVRHPERFKSWFTQTWEKLGPKLKSSEPLAVEKLSLEKAESDYYYLKNTQTGETFSLPDVDSENIVPLKFKP
ncbi:MAG: hypothetical protein IJJ84_12800 [Kiritimatiellae bacterium]|nr:hypothetical protein [Kiritimatiellia bacterium]